MSTTLRFRRRDTVRPPGETAGAAAVGDGDHRPHVAADPDPAPSSAQGPARRPGRLAFGHVAATAAIVFVVRWWFARERRVFHMAPDEPGQLAMARWLSGGPSWNMFDHITWRPGFATIVSPVFVFTDDATTAVRAILTLAAVIAALSAVLLAWLMTRLTRLPGVACAAIATAVAVLPTAVTSTAYIWAETVVTATTLAVIALLVRFGDDHRLPWALGAIACAAVGFTSHSRLAPAIGTTVLLASWPLARRRRWTSVGGVMAFGVLAGFASHRYSIWVIESVWESPADANTAGTVIERLDDLPGLLDSANGQLWYQLVGTAGLAGIGALAVGVAALRRRAADGTGRDGLVAGLDPWSARVVAFTILPLVMVSVAFMSGRTRPDQWVYGRYNDAVVWPVVALGLAWFVQRALDGMRRRDVLAAGAVGAGIAVTGLVVHARHGAAFAEDSGLRPMIAGLLPYTHGVDAVDVARATVIALLVFAGAVGTVLAVHAAPRRRMAGAIACTVAIALLAVAVARVHHASNLRLNGWAKAEAVRAVDELIPADAQIGVLMVPNSEDPSVPWDRQRQRYQLYQLYLPDHRFVRDRGPDDSFGPYVFAPSGDPTLRAAGATPLWTDPAERITLWREATVSP